MLLSPPCLLLGLGRHAWTVARATYYHITAEAMRCIQTSGAAIDLWQLVGLSGELCQPAIALFARWRTQ